MLSSPQPRRVPRWLLCLLVFVFLCCCANGQNNDTSPACPIYREFDVENPRSPQYNAPDGCRCVDGMSDLNCGYCESDEACQQVDSSRVCRSGLDFVSGDVYKAFQCRLYGTLESFFTNGKISVYADVPTKSIHMSVYNTETINDAHSINCHISGCNFVTGSNQVKCELAVCNCTDECASVTKSVVEGMISGNPAEVITTASENGYDSHIGIKIEGAPFDIEALCNATACVPDPDNAPLDETAVVATPISNTNVDTTEHAPSEWKSSATFSLIVLSILFGMALLLSICIFLPIIATWWKTRGNSHQNFRRFSSNQLSYDEYQHSSSQPKHILEFQDIHRVMPLKGAAAKAFGQKEKTILHKISGRVESGTLMGIMGPSGAGKSSLLNILAAVDNGQAKNSGQVLLNGKMQTQGYRRKVAYVQQDDTLYGTLTVQECIEYSAMLRLPKSMNLTEKHNQVWKTLQELRLTDIATNRIGTGGANAGVSGGERKRVSIGMELVAHPAVLFLDEPSSGLDSYAANQIMNVLHELATRNRIVVLSIHQPSMKSFLTMDQILLLGSGKVMYNGKPSQVGRYLEERGFPCPELETVADHMLDVVSNKANHSILRSPAAYNNSPHSKLPASPRFHDEGAGDGRPVVEDPFPRPMPAEPSSIVNEMMVLFGRTSKDIIRNRELFLMQLCLCTILACFVGAIFNGVSNDLAGFQNRMGAFYFSLSFFGFASFSSMDVFVKERHIFMRETGSKYFRVFSYFLTKTVLDTFVLRIIPATVFVVIFYWLMGLKSEPEAFVVFWATVVLFNVCAGIMSICISIATPTVGQANLIASVWFLIMLLFGGFLVNVQTMDAWFAWLRYLSIFYYAFEILMTNELDGLLLSFDAPGYPSIPVQGEVFLATIGMKVENQTRDLIYMCSLAFGFSIVAYMLLLLRVPISAGTHFRRMQNETERLSRSLDKLETVHIDGDEEMEDTGSDPPTPPHIAVTNLHAGSAKNYWLDLGISRSRSTGSPSPRSGVFQ
ncbi:Putative white-brown complex homolog protein 30 [Seminavis robusta]|uniref:White-brown complex homolog protein 30 n=1 Tax=Seminavis robusta TaxID=568900 RepID=A0A9N8HCG1_9STRA|nr:Putative white-brown complex homolog protein 30 [Seminavis robusta]|eukprot:Sro380_g130710.1 Putative white-brown complex homolog protein 30 (1009) ;mRNA; f:63754-67100